MDYIAQGEQNPATTVAAAVNAPLTDDEKRTLVSMTASIGDPEAARRVLDAARAATFAEKADLAPGVALGLAVDYQVRAFGELHGRQHGGTWSPERPIELDEMARRVAYSADPLDDLIRIGGGRAHRLRSGLLSMNHTADSTLAVCRVADAECLNIPAWTTASQYPYRQWWLRATITATDFLATPVMASEITLAIAAADSGKDHAPKGSPAVFTERRGTLLSEPIEEWFLSRSTGGTFHTTIQVVDPNDVPAWPDVVSPW